MTMEITRLEPKEQKGIVVELADTVSEVLEVKHACQKGIEPQAGIDY